MILVLGIIDEPVIAHFLDYLVRTDTNYVLIDERKLFENIYIEFEIIKNLQNGRIIFGEWDVDIKHITGIYNRLWLSQEHMDASYPSAKHLYQAILTTNFFLNSVQVPVLNRPSAHLTNNFKISQYPHIVHCGFKTPKTVIGNNRKHFKKAIQLSSHDWIVKSSGGTRSIVRKIDKKDLLSTVTTGFIPPHQFQELLQGYNVRVHVVGNIAIACKAETVAVDYRYADSEGENLKLEPYELPRKIEQNCVTLSKKLGLDFSGIDLFHTNDDQWFCFEVNPCPGYSWFEKNAGVDISKEIVRYLTFGK